MHFKTMYIKIWLNNWKSELLQKKSDYTA